MSPRGRVGVLEKTKTPGNRTTDRPVTLSAEVSCSYFSFTFTFLASIPFLLFHLLLFILKGKQCLQTRENCAMRSFAVHGGAQAGDKRNAYRLWWANLRKETTSKS